MNGIAIYYEGTCIYWSSIIIACGILSGFAISLALFASQNRFLIGFCFYIPNAIIGGLLLSRYLYWFCNKEQFDGMREAFTKYETGGYLIPGMIVSAIVIAALFRLVRIVPDINLILDPLAVGLAFMIGCFKFSCYFSDVCLGKVFVAIPSLQRLPFAVEAVDANGNVQYRLATYFITFIAMMIITVVLLSIWIYRNAKTDGHIFRLFLYMYALVEIIMDSTRYDAAHPTFDGEAFESLNKASGFMGLGQLFGAVSILYVFIYYMIKTVKKNGWKPRSIIAMVMYIVGFGTAGGAEYLVQRFTSMIDIFYMMMLAGLILIGISLGVLLKKSKAPFFIPFRSQFFHRI